MEVKKSELLKETASLLTDLNGFTENDFLMAGITHYEIINPTEEILIKLRAFHASALDQKREVRSIRR